MENINYFEFLEKIEKKMPLFFNWVKQNNLERWEAIYQYDEDQAYIFFYTNSFLYEISIRPDASGFYFIKINRYNRYVGATDNLFNLKKETLLTGADFDKILPTLICSMQETIQRNDNYSIKYTGEDFKIDSEIKII